MNREILFRGKRKDNGEWVEGPGINTQYDVNGEKHIYIGVLLASERYPLMQNIEWHEVIPETIGQYTGINVGSEKLFEGDIVEWHEDYDDTWGYSQTAVGRSVVVWDTDNFCWAFKTDDAHIQAFNDWTWDNRYIIGNIHDNPKPVEVHYANYTTEQIKTALEYAAQGFGTVKADLCADALILIKEQEAEIKRTDKHIRKLLSECNDCEFERHCRYRRPCKTNGR